jgi:16S rRNA (uracil1498-N3)-methyltransferase
MPDVAWCAGEPDAVAHVFVARLDDAITVDGTDGHHLQRVRRLRVGEVLTAADGSGAWRTYAVRAIGPGRLDLEARSGPRTEPALEPRITLALALSKAGLDQVVARVTELGVARVEPVRMRRAMVRWDGDRAAKAHARLQAIAREAAAQSRRARVPEIGPLLDLRDLAARPGLVVADRAGASAAALAPPGPEGWTVVVGPEGGFDPAELAVLPPGVPRLAVGPYVLRAETAPVAVVAALRGRNGGRGV